MKGIDYFSLFLQSKQSLKKSLENRHSDRFI